MAKVVRIALGLIALAACHGTSEPPPALGSGSGSAKAVELGEPAAPVKPDIPEGTRSLRLIRSVGVRLEPKEDAKRIGTIADNTRVAWTRTEHAKGCDKAWVEIVPRGWVCGELLEPSKRAPSGQEIPHLDRSELVPGTYGKVTAVGAVTYMLEKPDDKKPKQKSKHNDRGPVVAPEADAAPGVEKMVESKPLVGSVNVREYEELAVGGKVYWKISPSDNEYVLKSEVSPHVPSGYGGARLGDDTGKAVPIGFVWPPGGMIAVWTQNTATGGGVDRQLAARTAVPILDTASDKAGKPTAYRIDEHEWIPAAYVRVFTPAPPPPGLQPGERWIDVDLDTQILVAYDGDAPVYATMVSTGGKDTPTETGVYRMWRKVSETDMNGLNGEDPYSVATVPWTQFFSPEKGLALHTAYWHDQFGHTRSHGCVNLAPRDARWLYFWSDPQVPPGWSMAAGVVEAPGSIVRIRSKADPTPAEKGYAKKVLEVRQGKDLD
jgi:hypothetical protein